MLTPLPPPRLECSRFYWSVGKSQAGYLPPSPPPPPDADTATPLSVGKKQAVPRPPHTHTHIPLTCLPQVQQALLVDGEEAGGGAVLWAHVGDGGPVRNGQRCHPGPEELHKLAHHPNLTQVLRERQNDITNLPTTLIWRRCCARDKTTSSQTCLPYHPDLTQVTLATQWHHLYMLATSDVSTASPQTCLPFGFFKCHRWHENQISKFMLTRNFWYFASQD